MNAEHIQSRLHDALHRGHRKATEEELAEVTVELAVVIAELAARVQALEAQATT